MGGKSSRRGFSNWEIAHSPRVIEGTIKNRASDILQTGVRDRTRAVVEAFELQLASRRTPVTAFRDPAVPGA